MQSYTWIYSLSAEISDAKADELRLDFQQFTDQWKSHGTPVDGLIKLYYNRFVVIQSDPVDARPSGCSIDSLKRSIAQILESHRLECLDAAHVFYRDAESKIQSVHFQKISAKVQGGELRAESIVFDHSLSQSDDMQKWEVPMADTWLRRYLTVKQ